MAAEMAEPVGADFCTMGMSYQSARLYRGPRLLGRAQLTAMGHQSGRGSACWLSHGTTVRTLRRRTRLDLEVQADEGEDQALEVEEPVSSSSRLDPSASEKF